MFSKKIKKVFLLTPPAFTFRNMRDINPIPPMGLGYIAAMLERRAVEVKIFDSLIEGFDKEEGVSDEIVRVGASFQQIEEQIRQFSPDVVGVSNLFSRQAHNAHSVFALVKKISPDIIVIAGGAHPSVMPELVMEDGNVDFVVIGEGEKTICDLLDYLEGKKATSELDGVALREAGRVKIIPKKAFIPNLDEIPFPARHLMSMEKYFGLIYSHGKRHSVRFSPIVTSRGCPAGCTFCTAHHVWGRGFRKRSPRNVIEEMRHLKDKYAIEELIIEDDNVTLDVRRSEELFDLMINERINLKWDTPNGVAAFALNNRLINKMKEAGCVQLNIAIESGNKDVLKNIIRKPLDLDKVRPLIEYAKSINLNVGIFLIIGMPGESIEQMWDSYRFAKNLGIFNPFISIATPYPGSELYDLCIKKGYIRDNFSLDKLYITSCSISTEDWSGEDVRNVFNKGYMYLQFQYLKRRPFLLMKKIAGKILKDPAGFIGKVRLICQPMKK